ncbi:hypothetical protein Tco_0370250 [Tanacetum coccineum]
MVDETTNDSMKKNILMVVKEDIMLEREKTKAYIASMVDAFLRNYMNNHILHVNPTKYASSTIPDLQRKLYLKIKDDEQARDADLPIWLTLKYKFEKPTYNDDPCRVDAFHNHDHEYHHDDDARPKGESSVKRHITSEHGTYTRDQGIDDDEVPFEEVSPKFFAKVLGKGITTGDLQRMQDALNDMMIIHAFMFPKNDLEELNTSWIRKTVKRFILYARYVVDHWKSLRAQQSHIKRQLKTRNDPEDVYSEWRIIDIIRVQYNHGYRQEYMEDIMVKRDEGRAKCDILMNNLYESLNKKLVGGRDQPIIRRWDLTGIPCVHVVAAMYDMSNNGREIGIPQSRVDEAYWLSTWREMYRYMVESISSSSFGPNAGS